jgi:SAM-dependent methyltransferase
MNDLTYTFRPVVACSMCAASSEQFRVIGRRMNASQGLRPTRKLGISVTICRCRACGLIFPNPIPVPADLQQHYGRPPESYWSPAYFQVSPDYFAKQIKTFERLRTGSGPAKVLDVGAGIGKGMRALERAGYDAYGIEPSAPFRERALSMMQIAPERLLPTALEDADFPDNAFDWVTFGAVLEHLYEPNVALTSAARMLRPGGLIHAEVPSSNWLTNRLNRAAYRLQGLDYTANLSPMHAPFHIYEFALTSFERWAQRHGFVVAHHEFMVCRSFLPRIIDPLARWWMGRTDTGMQLEVWLSKAPGAASA